MNAIITICVKGKSKREKERERDRKTDRETDSARDSFLSLQLLSLMSNISLDESLSKSPSVSLFFLKFLPKDQTAREAPPCAASTFSSSFPSSTRRLWVY